MKNKIIIAFDVRLFWPAQIWNRVTASAIFAGSGRFTGQCVRSVFDPVFMGFNMRVYRGVVSTE